jgi:hypothetical protein
METKSRNSIKELGKEGEERARIMLNKLGFKLTSPDWIGKRNNKYLQFEVKMKSEPFSPPPFWGHGIDISQINRRKEIQEKHGLKCAVIVFEKDSPNIYYQWLDKLETGPKFDTRRRIRIYPIESFLKMR